MADTDIFFLLKFAVHAGTVVSLLRGHAKRLAERNVYKFLTQKKHIGISLSMEVHSSYEKYICQSP